MTIEANELGIPEDALRRLSEMKPGQRTTLFTSDLSVNEFLLVREAGFRPVGHIVFRKRYASSARFLRYEHECAYPILFGA